MRAQRRVLTAEQKKQKRKIILFAVGGILIFVILAIAFLMWQMPHLSEFGASGLFEESKVEAASEKIVELMNEKKYEEILKDYSSDVLRKDATAEDLEYAAAMPGNNWGSFQKIESCTLGEMKRSGKSYAASELKVKYENVTVTFTFSFDEQMKLSGIYMQ